jgi:protein-L-isoaspartate(D-aspartate) O-methyltransferase
MDPVDLSDRRDRMVATQIEHRGVRAASVLDAMRAVPRERFVPEAMAEFAYDDGPLPIGCQQTISQPYVVAKMLEAADLDAHSRVLDVGTGSGYAAALAAIIAERVYSIERHAELALDARRHIADQGLDNVELRAGDGTLGWPEAAPFDAILVAAGAPVIPAPLLQQLAIGGRLVMPIGPPNGVQRLTRVVRIADRETRSEDLGGVQFVPLIGTGGSPAGEPEALVAEPPAVETRRVADSAPGASIQALLTQAAEPLPEIDEASFAAAFDRYAGSRVVLLGEASHGTSEFYRARAAITRRLIECHGYTVVALEADWPDAATLDRYVRRPDAGPSREPAFQRFPIWMWRNTDMLAFLEWLRERNRGIAEGERVGIYGLDLYSLDASIRAVVDYLDRVDPAAARVARERYGCLTPWRASPQAYGRMALTEGYARCEEAVVQMLLDLSRKRPRYAAHDCDEFFDASANARLVQSAEAYYRAMYYGSAASWNLRDRHMADTLQHVLAARGAQAKAVVWAHNSHIGDARQTEMGRLRDEINLGELCRARYGDAACLIGFGTYAGTVAAASDWDAPMQRMTVRPGLPESIERLAHDTGIARFLLDLRAPRHAALRAALHEARLERFIGVIYRPDMERWSHYAECALAEQFDAYVWFDETQAVTPLSASVVADGVDETWPFGL